MYVIRMVLLQLSYFTESGQRQYSDWNTECLLSNYRQNSVGHTVKFMTNMGGRCSM